MQVKSEATKAWSKVIYQQKRQNFVKSTDNLQILNTEYYKIAYMSSQVK